MYALIVLRSSVVLSMVKSDNCAVIIIFIVRLDKIREICLSPGGYTD